MRQTIETEDAPAPLGPYSQGVRAGDFFFPAGQVPLDPETGAVVGADDVVAAAEQTLKNLGAILKAAGASYGNVVKASVYLADMNDFAAVNEVYARYFGESKPARVCVACSRLPKDVKLEIDAVAYLGD